jgi:hypothetical protein
VLPFNAQDSGRLGFRYPEEPVDERPVLVWGRFWTSEAERHTYETAVEKHPRRPTEGALSYAARISAVVTGAYQQAGLAMPRRGMSQREWSARQWEVKKAGGHAHFEEAVE